jgi:hypothetical protein
MNPHPPSWERLVLYLIGAAVSLQMLAGVLPRLLVPIVVLAVIFVIVRLVLFHTRHW